MTEKEKKKTIIEEIKDEETEEPYVPTVVEKDENKQLLWFLVIVAVLFGSFLVPYFYIQSTKSFDYAGISWTIEDLGIEVFHGRFPQYTNPTAIHNIYLREDPRENNVPAYGKYDSFKFGGIFSFSDEIENQCVGEVPRALSDMASFLSSGIGVGPLGVGTTNFTLANQTNTPYADCAFEQNKTVVIVELGTESFVTSSNINEACYTIKLSSCEDIAPIEKFMIETVDALYDLT